MILLEKLVTLGKERKSAISELILMARMNLLDKKNVEKIKKLIVIKNKED